MSRSAVLISVSGDVELLGWDRSLLLATINVPHIAFRSKDPTCCPLCRDGSELQLCLVDMPEYFTVDADYDRFMQLNRFHVASCLSKLLLGCNDTATLRALANIDGFPVNHLASCVAAVLGSSTRAIRIEHSTVDLQAPRILLLRRQPLEVAQVIA